eukprot:GEZU01002981.1.p1 GENE.GEZU01002981.1~~GEZU01002981.1.p1  ORF type:complete len:236 (+),score=31.03 GEZU01002981.1:33-710(+)
MSQSSNTNTEFEKLFQQEIDSLTDEIEREDAEAQQKKQKLFNSMTREVLLPRASIENKEMEERLMNLYRQHASNFDNVDQYTNRSANPKFTPEGEYRYPVLPFMSLTHQNENGGWIRHPFIPPQWIEIHSGMYTGYAQTMGFISDLFRFGAVLTGAQAAYTVGSWIRNRKFPLPMFVPLSASAMGLWFLYDLRWGNMVNRINVRAHRIMTEERGQYRFRRGAGHG